MRHRRACLRPEKGFRTSVPRPIVQSRPLNDLRPGQDLFDMFWALQGALRTPCAAARTITALSPGTRPAWAGLGIGLAQGAADSRIQFQLPAKQPKQIGEAIEIGQDILIHNLAGINQAHHATLGAPAHGPGHIVSGGCWVFAGDGPVGEHARRWPRADGPDR